MALAMWKAQSRTSKVFFCMACLSSASMAFCRFSHSCWMSMFWRVSSLRVSRVGSLAFGG